MLHARRNNIVSIISAWNTFKSSLASSFAPSSPLRFIYQSQEEARESARGKEYPVKTKDEGEGGREESGEK